MSGRMPGSVEGELHRRTGPRCRRQNWPCLLVFLFQGSLDREPQEYGGSPRALHCGRLEQTPKEGPSEQPEKKTRGACHDQQEVEEESDED